MSDFSFWHWVIIAFFAWLAWRWLLPKKKPIGAQWKPAETFAQPVTKSPTPKDKSKSSAVTLKGDGSFDIAIAGVEHYRAQLEKGFRSKLKEARGGAENPELNDSETINATLTLAYEDDNPHDGNAVSVLLRGVRIGYLPKGIAPLFRAYIQRENLQGSKYLCKAEVDLPLNPSGEWEIAVDLPRLNAPG